MSGVTARVRMVAASLVLGLAFSFAPAVPAQAVLVNVIQDTLFTWGLKQAGGGALGQIGGFFVREITGIGRDRSPEILAQLDEIQAQLGEVSSQLRDLQADVSSIQSELRAARSEDDVAMINAYTAELINFNNVRLTPLVNATVNLGRADYSGDSTAIATAVARFQVQRAAHVDYWDTVNACVAARCFSLRLAVISIAQQLIPPPRGRAVRVVRTQPGDDLAALPHGGDDRAAVHDGADTPGDPGRLRVATGHPVGTHAVPRRG